MTTTTDTTATFTTIASANTTDMPSAREEIAAFLFDAAIVGLYGLVMIAVVTAGIAGMFAIFAPEGSWTMFAAYFVTLGGGFACAGATMGILYVLICIGDEYIWGW